MSEQKSARGGYRENSGRPPKDSENKQKHSYKLTDDEKEVIDSYRASKGLEK
jgi:hypothetical protein